MIPEFLRPYSKLVVGVIGLATIIAMNRFGVQNASVEDLLLGLARDCLVGGLTSFGIFQATNTPVNK